MADQMTWKSSLICRAGARPRSAIGRLRLIDPQCACGLAINPKKLGKVDKD
jgi:hypothetical protein